MRNRAAWEKTWDLQRAEDRGEKVEIDVPRSTRAPISRRQASGSNEESLTLPKERFTSYPGCASDGSDLYGWAGFDQSQRAKALATRIAEAQDHDGRPDEVILKRMLPGLRGFALGQAVEPRPQPDTDSH